MAGCAAAGCTVYQEQKKQHSGIKEKATLGKTYLEQPERERNRLAEISTSMMRDNRSRVGDVTRSLGGILVTPPVAPDYTRRYFGELKGFPKIDELITIVSVGVPVIAPPSQADLESALRYGNHRSAEERHHLIWEKPGRRAPRKMPRNRKKRQRTRSPTWELCPWEQ